MLYVPTSKETYMTIGQKIYESRKKAGMTQEELADRLGVSRQAVSKWESDIAYPETDKLVELCRLFSLSADELLLDAREESDGTPQSKSGCIFDKRGMHLEYVSNTRVGGLSLVHINLGLGHYRAKGIIAIGNVATGVVAIGFISVGLLGIGLIALGLIALGTLALGLAVGAGGIATGALALGGVAIGVMCFGGVCVGYIAVGGLTVGQYAVGGYARGFLAVGQSYASGAHAFTMPTDFGSLCSFIDSNIRGWLAGFIKTLAKSLGR